MRRSIRFRRAAGLAILALALQVLLPLRFPAMAAGFSPDRTVHCSMAAGGLAARATGKVKTTSCPVCQMLHMLAAGYVPPHGVKLSILPRRGEELAVAAKLEGPQQRLISQAQPRAPPVLA